MLQHWSDLLPTFPDQDDAPGLIKFAIGPSGEITGFRGEDCSFGLMTNYGSSDRFS